ncbi:MAG: trimeric intracellular cation channel family protein [Ancrocorticia sp.]|uniref:trimeric intracellular cation channel family protein n=1 Tax=Ancrocorticia sp. TaxID=2593684 RepID=UPI003F8F88F7
MDLASIFPTVFQIFDLAGVVVAGTLGGMVAREMRLDIVGFLALAVMSALGGGMIRDTLLQMGPPVALTNPYYLPGAFTGAIFAFFLTLSGKWWNRFLLVADAFVLGAWTATGVVKTLEGGFGILPAILMGTVTAVGGGMIRDVAVGRIPSIFGGNTLYATASVIASAPAIILWYLGYPTIATAASTLVAGAIAITARRYRWSLPVNDDYSLRKSIRRMHDRAKAKPRFLKVRHAPAGAGYGRRRFGSVIGHGSGRGHGRVRGAGRDAGHEAGREAGPAQQEGFEATSAGTPGGPGAAAGGTPNGPSNGSPSDS